MSTSPLGPPLSVIKYDNTNDNLLHGKFRTYMGMQDRVHLDSCHDVGVDKLRNSSYLEVNLLVCMIDKFPKRK